MSSDKRKYVELSNHLDGTTANDTLHQKQCEDVYCSPQRCTGSIMLPPIKQKPSSARSTEELLAMARDFSHQYFESKKQLNSFSHDLCWSTVEQEILQTGHYELTEDELLFGAKTAWRNSQRCIARIQWQTLKLFDARKVETARGMFDAILRHVKYAASVEGIPSTMTVFKHRTRPEEDFRIWNHQLIKYAGFRQADGSIIGDPASVEITEIAQGLGWKGKVGPFEILPIIVSVYGQDPEFFEIPTEFIKEVQLKHPEYPEFAEVGLKWYTVPAVSNMIFDVGGILFPACAFSGCYMNTEIARNLCDSNRYNVMERLATNVFHLDINQGWSLWKDRVFLEVNKAVLHSLQSNNITVIDHHTASDSFVRHLQNEQKSRGGCPADWVWIVPPLGGSLLSVWHQEMLDYRLTPSFSYQPDAWVGHIRNQASLKQKRSFHFREIARAVLFSAVLMCKVRAKRIPLTILYATETGKAERYAKRLADLFKHGFYVSVIPANEYDMNQLARETFLLAVASTFGNGDPPENGKAFGVHLREIMEAGENSRFASCQFAVFGLGSSAYPHFCTYAYQLDQSLDKLGGARLLPIQTGDEIKGQDQSFTRWAQNVLQAACRHFGVSAGIQGHFPEGLGQGGSLWTKGGYQLTSTAAAAGAEERLVSLQTALGQTHRKDIKKSTLYSRRNLQSSQSERQTILVELAVPGEVEYLPGDHVAIFPRNGTASVTRILARLDSQYPSDIPIEVEKMVEAVTGGKYLELSNLGREKQRLPFLSLKELLASFLDITTPPSQTFLSCLATLTSNQDERDVLTKLSESIDKYENWKRFNWPTLLDVLDEFPSIELDPTLLLMELPILQPRFYSISSSPLVNPTQIDVTVAVLTYVTKGGNGPEHSGVCSSFLNSCPVDQELFFYVRRTPTFYLPEKSSAPIYMISAGAGIAPFRGFWQHLSELGEDETETSSEVTLVFGCRNSKLDYIYQEEIESLQKRGVLTHVHLALSRELSFQKTYVQHVIPNIARRLHVDLYQRGGHVYVCGDVGMAAGVQDAIKQVFMSEGLSEAEATEVLADLQKSNRYHEDIFGNYKSSASC